jgi:hypothetical protein
MYRKILMQRDEIASQLQRLQPVPRPLRVPGWLPPRPDQDLLDLPIAPPRLVPAGGALGGGVFGQGFQGYVQAPAATEGQLFKLFPPNAPAASGSIMTTDLTQPGVIGFDGKLHTNSNGPFDGSIKYFWVKNWSFIVPFPKPPIHSILTYRVSMDAFVNLSFSDNSAMLQVFGSLGETANLLPGQTIPIDIDADLGFPINADLTLPTSTYSGHFGYFTGQKTAQHSFLVEAGHTPAIAIVVGAIVGTSMHCDVNLGFDGIVSQIGIPTPVAFRCEPQFDLEPSAA